MSSVDSLFDNEFCLGCNVPWCKQLYVTGHFYRECAGCGAKGTYCDDFPHAQPFNVFLQRPKELNQFLNNYKLRGAATAGHAESFFQSHYYCEKCIGKINQNKTLILDVYLLSYEVGQLYAAILKRKKQNVKRDQNNRTTEDDACERCQRSSKRGDGHRTCDCYSQAGEEYF